MACLACGASWPVIEGVPAYRSAEYFGEIDREDMRRLVRSAETGHWRLAARERFMDSNPDMYHYIADLNRASWIPLLPISPDSTVLDVGSGLGVLTHALAVSYARVVSIEPIEERVRFTRVRLEQEGLKNVDLIQTTLDALPFFDTTFDLIVLNGVLEWIGAWCRTGTPREVQIECLAALRRLMKPDGTILIGIENRIGFDSFLGRVDHPGVRFTNLMPRGLASFYLKLRRPGFYRTLLDSAQGYRTYTYSPRGYVKLLREAGFESVELWWPTQGYNLPHELYRLSEQDQVRKYFRRDRNYKNRVQGHAFRRTVKEWALVKTGLIFSMVPDVILMAGNAGGRPDANPAGRGSLLEAIGKRLAAQAEALHGVQPRSAACHAVSLKCASLRNKSVIELAAPTGSFRAVAKVANVGLSGASILEHGFTLLQRLHAAFEAANPCLPGTVPRPLALLRIGSLVASVESAAAGVSLEDLSMEPGYWQDPGAVRSQLDRIAAWLIAAQAELGALVLRDGTAHIPADWRRGPGDQTRGPQETIPGDSSWVQHGDFFPGNVFWDRGAGRVTVIDWDQCAAGYPPLFDWFCFVTGLYYTHDRIRRWPRGQEVDERSFRQTYFESSWFAEAVLTGTNRLCESLRLDGARVPDYFRQYLLVRYRQFDHERGLSRKALWAERYGTFHDFFQRNRARCIFHTLGARRDDFAEGG